MATGPHSLMPLGLRSGSIIVAAVLLLLGQCWWMWKLRTRPVVIPHTHSLIEFPSIIDHWTSSGSLSRGPQALPMLNADDVLGRTYKDQATGRTLVLVVAYYRTQLHGHAVNDSRLILLNTSWSSVSSTIVELPQDSLPAARVGYEVVAQGRERRLVLSWFQTKTRVLTDAQKLHFYRTIDAIAGRRTDVASVQIVTPLLDGESVETYQPAMKFAEAARRLLHALLFAPSN